eukprot:3936892-Rhodomonas_salina.1
MLWRVSAWRLTTRATGADWRVVLGVRGVCAQADLQRAHGLHLPWEPLAACHRLHHRCCLHAGASPPPQPPASLFLCFAREP